MYEKILTDHVFGYEAAVKRCVLSFATLLRKVCAKSECGTALWNREFVYPQGPRGSLASLCRGHAEMYSFLLQLYQKRGTPLFQTYGYGRNPRDYVKNLAFKIVLPFELVQVLLLGAREVTPVSSGKNFIYRGHKYYFDIPLLLEDGDETFGRHHLEQFTNNLATDNAQERQRKTTRTAELSDCLHVVPHGRPVPHIHEFDPGIFAMTIEDVFARMKEIYECENAPWQCLEFWRPFACPPHERAGS